MLKRIFASLCLVLLVFVTVSFSREQGEPIKDIPVAMSMFEGMILEAKDSYLYVAPLSDDSPYDADKYKADIPAKDRAQAFQKGDKVTITFSGKVQEVYPPVLANVTDIRLIHYGS